jgi:GNAT superfamily N-acetyltransferase
MGYESKMDDFEINTDKGRIDFETVHGYLSRSSYWAIGVPAEIVRRSIENSLVFGIYKGSRQVGFARVITDYATFAYLADVFVLEEFRGHGLGKWLVDVIIAHPDLQGLRRWMLATKDAHELYKRVGFTEIKSPEKFMEITRPY